MPDNYTEKLLYKDLRNGLKIRNTSTHSMRNNPQWTHSALNHSLHFRTKLKDQSQYQRVKTLSHSQPISKLVV